jgi:biopolymer transport protein ExbD
MRFYPRRKRQPPPIIIVAMIDVLIVVLIFLMVTTSFKKVMPSFRITLPEASHATKSGATETPPLHIVIEADGNFRFGPNAISVTVDRLKEELAAAVEKDPQLKVMVEADTKAPFGQWVKITDIAAELKIKSVVVATKEAPKH